MGQPSPLSLPAAIAVTVVHLGHLDRVYDRTRMVSECCEDNSFLERHFHCQVNRRSEFRTKLGRHTSK